MGVGHVWVLLILLVGALLIFGPDRLPEISHNMGRALSAFRRELHGDDDSEGDITPAEL
jgi:TatA/E family protein of Tat protein translocase